MEISFPVQASDFSTNAPQSLQKIQSGKIAFFVDRDSPFAVLLDIHDYRLLRAAVHHYTSNKEQRESPTPPQDRYDMTLSGYLSGQIDLYQAAMMLDLPWIDLLQRLSRLDIPVNEGTFDLDDSIEELRAIRYIDFPNAWR